MPSSIYLILYVIILKHGISSLGISYITLRGCQSFCYLIIKKNTNKTFDRYLQY